MSTGVVLVSQGLGMPGLPRLPLSGRPMGTLQYKPIYEETAQRRIGIVYRQNRHLSPASRAFIGQVKEVAAKLSSRSEEHTSELQSLMRISYAVFCLKKKKKKQHTNTHMKNKRYMKMN